MGHCSVNYKKYKIDPWLITLYNKTQIFKLLEAMCAIKGN